MLQTLNREKGFTLIELLVVIVVIGILIALTLPNLFATQQRARDGERKNDLRNIQQQLEAYYNDNNAYPNDTAALVTAGYMDEVPTDPQPTGSYAYAPGPDGCTATSDCQTYTLTATLENENDPEAGANGAYVVESVNQ